MPWTQNVRLRRISSYFSFSPYFDNKDTNQDFSSIARIIIDTDSHHQYSYELHTVQVYNYSNIYTGVSGRDTSMLLVDLSDNWIEKKDKTAHFYIDRANIQFELQDLDLHFGRLAVGFGKPSLSVPFVVDEVSEEDDELSIVQNQGEVLP